MLDLGATRARSSHRKENPRWDDYDAFWTRSPDRLKRYLGA